MFFSNEKKKKELQSIRMNRYKFVVNNKSGNNTNVKLDINKIIINRKRQFRENIVIGSEISEQNS